MPSTSTVLAPPMVGNAAALGEQDTARARTGDLATSHEAADSNDVTRSLGLVLDILREARMPLTDEQIEFRATYGRGSTFTGQRLRTARRALERQGLVEIADKRGGKTSTGRRCATFRAVVES